MRRAVAVVALLLVAACGREAKDRAERENAMRHDLFEMRKAIADFRADKQRGPHSLQELKDAHYLRAIPKDPLTLRDDWREITEQVVAQENDFAAGSAAPPQVEVVDVRSRAAGKDAAGKPYADY